MTEILPKGWSNVVGETKYRPEEQIEFVIRTTLEETGLVKRLKIEFLSGRINVHAFSNKRSGGWRIDLNMNSYQFTFEDTLDQMKSFVSQEFFRVIRNTFDTWLNTSRRDSAAKVLMGITTDLKTEADERREAYLAKIASGKIIDDGIN